MMRLNVLARVQLFCRMTKDNAIEMLRRYSDFSADVETVQ